MFIAKDNKNKDLIWGLSMIGYYNTQLNVSITNKKNRHHSLQLDLDKFCEYNPVTNMVTVTHNGALSFGRGGSMKRQVVIDYVKDKAPDLIRENKVYLGCIDNSRLLEWEHSDVQNFIKTYFDMEYFVMKYVQNIKGSNIYKALIVKTGLITLGDNLL